MATPNFEFQLIHKFPLDILAGIMLFVPGEDIGRLKITGCKSLWSKLTCPNVVRSVKLGNGGLRFKSWPSFMNEFPSLESLRIENETVRWWSEMGLALNQLPSTLRCLSLIRKQNNDQSYGDFFEIPTISDTILLDEHLPHLEELEIWDNKANLDWVSHCPPTLTSLNVYHWKPEIALPSSIIHFKSHSGIPTGYPLAMESLGCGRENYSHSLPCLTSLSAYIGKDSMAKLEDIVALPQSLTNLDVRNILPSASWPSLPTNLQSLSFQAADAFCTVIVKMVDPINGEVHQVEACPLELLPKSLTKIRISGNCLFVSGSCSSLFPPHLKSFDAPFLKLAPNAAKQLPSSLTHFSTWNFHEELCENLPQGLTSLSFINALLSPKTIQCLPKSLTRLNCSLLIPELEEDEWFDYTTGETILSSS